MSSIFFQDEQNYLPNKPLNYGETNLHFIPGHRYYTHYPQHLFDYDNLPSLDETTNATKDNQNSISAYNVDFDLCNELPGTGVKSLLFQEKQNNLSGR